jgi:hypothetical protein
MRLVQWYDDDGFLRQAYVRDDDPDELAEVAGVVHEPPDLKLVNWDDVARDLNNELVQRGIITWEDVQRQQAGLTNAVTAVLKRRLVVMYRQRIE